MHRVLLELRKDVHTFPSDVMGLFCHEYGVEVPYVVVGLIVCNETGSCADCPSVDQNEHQGTT